MPKIQFTEENMLERQQLEATWYKLKVVSVIEGPGKSDPKSTVYTVDFIVDEGPSKGVPIKHWFSEKAMGRIVDFLKAFTAKVEAGKEYDLADTISRHVMGFVKYDEDRQQNTIDAFKKA